MSAARPPEFRRRAVELARSGEYPVAKIAGDLGIADSWLRRWMTADDIAAGSCEGSASAPLPAAVFTLAAGALFGVTEGLIVVEAGATVGAVVGFWLGRGLGRGFVARVSGASLEKLDERFARRGVLAVLVVRLLPVLPFAAVNYLSGLTSIRFRDYLAGTAAGILPAAAYRYDMKRPSRRALRRSIEPEGFMRDAAPMDVASEDRRSDADATVCDGSGDRSLGASSGWLVTPVPILVRVGRAPTREASYESS